MQQLPVYLDHHATTPCDPRVLEAMLPWFSTDFGNASSRQHIYGLHAAEAVKKAREAVAAIIMASAEEIIFTSGATESINLAIKGVAEMYAQKGRHIVTCSTEHAAVLDACAHLERQGYTITKLPVDGNGLISLEELQTAIRHDTILVSIMLANNETGVIQDVRQIGAICRERGVFLLTDATQAVGKLPIDVDDLQVDLLCLSAHKFYGPKGVGALYVRRRDPRVRLTALIDGGGQEKGWRSGTLNVPGIVGMGEAAAIAQQEMPAAVERMQLYRDRLEQQLCSEPAVFVNGSGAPRLATVSNLSFQYTEGAALLGRVVREVAVSSGAACSSATLEPSHVLTSMGLGRELAYASLRISIGRTTTAAEMDFATRSIRDALRAIRAGGQLWAYGVKGELPHPEAWYHPALG